VLALNIIFAALKLKLMSISTEQLLIALSIAAVLGGSLAYLFWKQRREVKTAIRKRETGETQPAPDTGTRQLQLQAYERLILLTDRLALPNLVSRVNQQGLTAREMQALLTQTIKQEFEYNVTQQIYVTAESWEAVRNLRDQNLLIINQISSYLPPEATGQDLNRSILEMLMQQPKASLHNVVSDVLSYEAKKLMR
jgi:hypothetical protein